MHKTKLFFIIGVFWILILGGVIGLKEFTLQTGTEILLKTTPVDPRDLFRGDYVILQYEISNIDTKISHITDYQIGDDVYVLLKKDENNQGSFMGIQKYPPETGNFIKGIIKRNWNNSLNIEYGIESYFVPEGEGGVIEKNTQNILVKVVIDTFGNAVIKSILLNGEEIGF